MARPSQLFLASLFASAAGGCALMPRELNLTPLWFHRLDGDGSFLEWDLLWPIVHYERTPQGGDDLRIRPLWRRVTEPTAGFMSDLTVEHQFLWPLGRARFYADETEFRLFPLWRWWSHQSIDHGREVDWYAFWPFLWGGTAQDGRENYFAFLPFFGTIRQFISYDRFRTILFPLYVGLEKGGHRHDLFLWPFIGISRCAESGHRWFRILPFYGHDIQPGVYDRRFVLWPFIAWSKENEDTASGPVYSYWFWPLFGWRTGPGVSGWMALWPFFQSTAKEGHFYALTLFWPIFRYYWNRAEDNVTQWWVWPLLGRVRSDDQNTRTFLWAVVWFREYHDPEGRNEQQWVVPFFWQVTKERKAGEVEHHVKVWPLFHRTANTAADGSPSTGEWSFPSPWPLRDGNAYGIREAYGWLWEILRGVRRGPDDTALDVVGRLYTERSTGAGATASVPLLFNYERDAAGRRTLRLLQFLPIPLGTADAQTAEATR